MSTQALKFHKTPEWRSYMPKYVACDDKLSYVVVKLPGERTWTLTIHETYTLDRRFSSNQFDTKALAVAVAREYAALGEDYKPHEHRHHQRSTEAIIRAYDAEIAKLKAEVNG